MSDAGHDPPAPPHRVTLVGLAARVPEDRISRNAGFAFLTKLISAALTAGLTIFLARALTPKGYGDFAFALSVVTLCTLFADLGIAASASRFLAEHRGDHRAVAGVFRSALGLKVAIGLVASAALFVLAGPICSLFGVPSAGWPVRGMSISLFGESMLLLLIGSFSALGRQRFNLIITASESFVEVTASVALVLVGTGAAGAAFGRATGYAVGFAVGLVVAARAIGPLPARPQRVARVTRGIIRYAGSLVLIDAAFRAFASIDVLLVTAILGGGAHVGAFQLPMRLATLLEYPVAAVATAVAPRLARREGGGPDIATFSSALRYLTLLQVLLVAPLLVWPEAIIHLLFGNDYPEAPAVLRALAPYVYLAGVAQLATLGVNYLGEASRRIPITLAMLAVNALVDLLLLPRVGVVGAGIGTSAAFCIWVPAHLWILNRRAGVSLRPFLVTSARAMAAGLAVCGVLLLLGTGELGVGVMLAGAVLGSATYVAVLIGLGEVNRDDLAMLRRLLARGAPA